jgi:hypothetical protein
MNVVRGGGEDDEDHEILSPLLRFTVVCNEESKAFLEESDFPHESLSHHVLGDKGTWETEKRKSRASQQNLNNRVSHCCEAPFVALTPGVKLCRSQ